MHHDDLLPFYDTLLDHERAEVDAHLKDCAECRAALDQWRKIGTAAHLKGLQEATSLPPLTILKDKKPMTIAIKPRPNFSSLPLIAALLLVMLVTSVVLFNPKPAVLSVMITPTPPTQNMLELLQQDSRLSRMAEAIENDPVLREIFTGTEPITVFAISNELFGNQVRNNQNPLTEPSFVIRGAVLLQTVNGAWMMEQLVEQGRIDTEWEGGGYKFSSSVGATRTQRGTILLNGKIQILEGNILATNGVLHIVDLPLAGERQNLAAQQNYFSIYDHIIADERLTMFVKAVENSEWAVEVLTGHQSITIFVPTDEAWLAAGYTVEDIEERILFVHIVNQLWSQELLTTVGSFINRWERDDQSVLGSRLTAELVSEQTLLNKRAQIIEGDIIRSNGIIQIIDAPLTTLEP